MSERLSFRLGVVVACVVALCTIFLAQRSIADTTCPIAGQRLTVASDAVVQNGTLPVGTCYNPNALGINQTSQQAKQDLQSMVCNSGVNIQNLDANFAVCADTFMKALRQAAPGACINSAYRNPTQQLAACMSICGASSCPGKCAAPGSSFHQKGLAIDVSYKISNSQAWQIANTSTNGGIANPSGLHGSDPAHFQATGSSCSGAPVPASDTTDVYTGTQTGPTPSTSAPQSSLSPQQTAQPAQVTQAQPVQTQTPQQTAATTPTVAPISPLAAATTSAAASSLLASLLQPAPSTFFSTATSATAALNIMMNLGSVGTSATAFFNSTIINTIVAGNATTTQAGASNTQETSYLQDTFSDNSQQYVSGNVSTLDQILQPLKNALTSLLSFLRSL